MEEEQQQRTLPHRPRMRNVNKLHDEQLTVGQKIADKVASTVGSWPFIIIQSGILALWLLLNSIALINHWDPYPFILLNLMLSFQAAYSAPFVMMSQNRQSEKDRITADETHAAALKDEEDTHAILERIERQDGLIVEIARHLEEQDSELLKQTDLLVQLHQRRTSKPKPTKEVAREG